MAQQISHRGPDDDGIYVDGSLALGFRRLSIVDLTRAGHQPMQSKCGRYVLVYNGEIYNFEELRLELIAKGYVFRSTSDTEVVLYALAEWGAQAISRLNGMFAFALYDKNEKTILLARDRYGIKPLYFARQKGTVFFGSEVKSFFPHPSFSREVNAEALIEYFTFQNFFSDQTLFKSVTMIPAGTWIKISLSDGSIKEKNQYWDFDFRSEMPAREEKDYLEELSFLFKQAVTRQFTGDREISSYLSGGMDSGSIAAVASQYMPEMTTFTVGFDKHSSTGMEVNLDEREQAEHMSYLFGTRHYEMVLKAGDMEKCMSKLVWHLEEPRVGQSYPNFYAANLASRFSPVVLSGTGSDELFGGYPWRYYRVVENANFDDYIDKYYSSWQRLMSNKQLWKVFSPIQQDVRHVRTRDIFHDVFRQHADQLNGPEDYVNHSLYLEAKTFLHGLLTVEDKLSMAHGLEARVPFLDNDLVDFAMRLPVKHKLGKMQEFIQIDENDHEKRKTYFEKSQDGKLLLRKMMSNFVPTEISSGIKKGFSAPDQSWFKGESIDFVKDKIGNKNSGIYNWMDFGSVQELVDEHLSGTCNHRLLIWSLLYMDEWSSSFLKNDLRI